MATLDVKKQRFIAAAQEFAGCLAEWIYEQGNTPTITLPPTSFEESTEPLLNLKEAARLMRVSVSTFKRKVALGDIRPVKVTGKAARYKREDIDRLIRRLK